MKATHTYTVVARLPEALAPLRAVARNLGWHTDTRVADVFRRIDPEAWDRDALDPLEQLDHAAPERLLELAADQGFVDHVAWLHGELQRSLTEPRWFQHHHQGALRQVAYFSPEFGIATSLPQYSGGLGILAGDHLKAADELGVPLIAIGLFYHHGYFRQSLDRRGWQQEQFPRLDPRAMALEPVDGVRVTVELAGVPVHAGLWLAQVGRIPLYLLDTDVEENDPEQRLVTDRLYGGGQEQRIRQEVLLGVGGHRAVEALGERPQVFHLNEGHAGFLALERIRLAVVRDGLPYREAVEATGAAGVFTTHTPVPAGIDRFGRDLMERYFSGWCRECGVTLDDLMALGHEPGTATGSVFNLACMSLRLAGFANGVSKLHGDVSRRMFAHVWPDVPVDEVPIGSVTNGVHARTFVSRPLSDLFERRIGDDWSLADPGRWLEIEHVSDGEVWAVRAANREAMVRFVRHRVRAAHEARGTAEGELGWVDDLLDPDALTLGFARRFASYKRATLLLSQPERLRRLLLDGPRPVQLVFAGKAHPADDPGKELLRQVAEFASDPAVRHRIAFVENYDISVGRVLTQGVDVWLNNPLRPLEACGTSGMKATLNGALNCSVLDGWFDELYDPECTWAIASATWTDDLHARNTEEADSAFHLIETQIAPLFYQRDPDGLPSGWLRKVKRSIARIGPQVEANRMVRDYVEHLYAPAAARAARIEADGFAGARALTAWKERVAAAWPDVAVVTLGTPDGPPEPGHRFTVLAQVTLGALGADDVDVQLVHGLVGDDDELVAPIVAAMDRVGPGDHAGWWRYAAEVDSGLSGTFGFTARIVPRHPDLAGFAELGLVAWASGPPE
jgi:glycogen phosphorylase